MSGRFDPTVDIDPSGGIARAAARLREAPVPVFDETMGGALIDSTRITLMAAMSFFPEAETQILLPGQEATPAIADCLEQAMNWLDTARAITIERGAQPTSFHVVKRG